MLQPTTLLELINMARSMSADQTSITIDVTEIILTTNMRITYKSMDVTVIKPITLAYCLKKFVKSLVKSNSNRTVTLFYDIEDSAEQITITI